MHKITLDFDYRKATQALNYFAVKEGGRINKMKALKLVYFADRYHLRKYGRPVTNDTYFAMSYGPVPSGVKDVAEGSEFLGDTEKDYARIYLDRETGSLDLRSASPVDKDALSESDVEALAFAWERFGHLDRFELARRTHEYPEWTKHRAALSLVSRIQMTLTDFLDDPATNVEKCFELTPQDREARLEQLEEMVKINGLWS
ncbi:MAG: SocA family protein [Chloroflexi bacterium]|nr:SocA family protein [Chloroflexota bacterium]